MKNDMAMTNKISRYRPRGRQIIIAIISASVLLLIMVGAGFLWWYLTPQEAKDLADSKGRVGRHMLLPTNEEPTLATVADKTKLKNTYLASKANNGDQLLIYTQNQIAVIYRPSIDKIVAVATVSADSAFAESQKATITVLNGADDAAKTQKIIQQLKTAYPQMTVTDGGAANKHDFATTIVIDSTEEKDYLVDAIATLSGGARGVVPLSEAKANTDLMIIVGKD